MKKLSVFIFILLFILSGCSKTPVEQFGKIPISKLPKEYLPDTAIENGDYVNLHGEISNENVMADFLEKVDKNEEAFMRTVQYTIEGDPLINDFYYDKNKFTVTTDNTRDAWGGSYAIRETKEFKYLKTHSIIDPVNGEYIYTVVTNLENFDDMIYFPGENTVILKNERPAIIGRFLRLSRIGLIDSVPYIGSYILVADESAYLNNYFIDMKNLTGNKNVFADLQNGDKIKVTGRNISNSDPSQMEILSCKLIEKGSINDIPQDFYNNLLELGWINEE